MDTLQTPRLETIENVLQNGMYRMGLCQDGRGGHFTETVFHK